LALVLIAEFLERLLQLGLVLARQAAIDLADLDLATGAGLCELLGVHLILEGQLLAQALILVLQVHAGQGLSLQLLAKIIQLATQTVVLQGEFLGLILELLAIGQSLAVLAIDLIVPILIKTGVVLGHCGLLCFLL